LQGISQTEPPGHLARKAISDTGIGANDYVLAGGLDLAAEVGDVGPQHLQVVFVFHPPDLDEELAVGHEAPRVADQHPQQLELGGGEVDVGAIAAHRP
jgi:hypothetical protein